MSRVKTSLLRCSSSITEERIVPPAYAKTLLTALAQKTMLSISKRWKELIDISFIPSII